MSRLTDVIALLYQMQSDDVKALSDQILEARKQAWRTTLREQAQINGCGGAVNDPRKKDLVELRRMSKKDAESIAKTWNRDVRREIERIATETPTANRQTYYSRLERWAADRAAWKDRTIALQTEMTTREYAQSRYRDENNLSGRGARYVFEPGVASCKTCTRLIGMGEVGQNVVDRYGSSQHVNCIHSWRLVRPPRIPCNQLWKG